MVLAAWLSSIIVSYGLTSVSLLSLFVCSRRYHCIYSDPRVPYWEPTKLGALIRNAQSTANAEPRPVCIKMEMAAGHFSASDRYKYLRELAYDYAFLLDQVGLVDN